MFNENTDITRTVRINQIIDTSTNRLGRYFLLSFTMRLQQFAGSCKPGGGFRNGGGGRGGGSRRGSFG